jgi:uracil-DNA glycosylase
VITVTLDGPDDFSGWRDAARRLVGAGTDPARVAWMVAGEGGSLFGGDPLPPEPARPLAVPRAFVTLAQTAILHRDRERFVLLHQLLHDLSARGRRLDDRADPLVARAEALAKSVRRDIHKMRAFVRFRLAGEGESERYVAWFEPEHYIVRTNARFFIDRFAGMRWSILTPDLSIHWDGESLSEGPGATRADAPSGDPLEGAWKLYYASIFNPARLKVGAMLKEMPRKYWANMPETALVPDLIAGAQARSRAMIAADPTTARTSEGQVMAAGRNSRTVWERIRDDARVCTRCPLHEPATQTVFGEGPVDADLMLVGEQPGDSEDLAGRPFVGPAGQLLDAALEEAGLDRARIYLTNAVKHFKFEPRGKRRIHSSPSAGEISVCNWWLGQELELVRPRLVVALGASAARGLFGRAMPVGKSRGQALALPDGTAARVTVHPSYLLRLPDAEAARAARADFVADLAEARTWLSRL